MSNDNSSTKVCIEVFADNHISNLSEVVENALREASNADADDDLSDALGPVVTGGSEDAAVNVIEHVLERNGIDTNWRSDAYNHYEPKSDNIEAELDEEDYQQYDDPEMVMKKDAMRRACQRRAWSLTHGHGDLDPVDEVVVVYDADGANRDARNFIDNILEEGASFMPVPVEGEAPDDSESSQSASEEDVSSDTQQSDADNDGSTTGVEDGVPEASDADNDGEEAPAAGQGQFDEFLDE